MSTGAESCAQEPRFLREYAEELRAIGEARFVEQHRFPVLVGVGMIGELARTPDHRRRTREVVRRREPASAPGLLDRVWPLAPCARPLSERYITLGHDAECDVVIDEHTLSANHCAFSRTQPTKLADLGSLNGTYIDDRVIPARKPVRIEDGAGVTIGRLKLRYHTRDGFIVQLRELLGDG